MAALDTEQWDRLYQQKRHALMEERCVNALQINNFDELQDSFRELTTRHGQYGLEELLSDFEPTLDGLKSFALIVGIAAQYEHVAEPLWGAVQAVFETACKSPYMLTEVFALMSELNGALPQLSDFVELLQVHRQELHWPLQDLYDDFIDYCIVVVQYLKTKSSSILNYVTQPARKRKAHEMENSTNIPQPKLAAKKASILEDKLRRTKEKMNKHTEEFKDDVAHVRRHVTRQQKLYRDRPSDSPIRRSSEGPKGDTELDFVTTVNMYRNYTFVGRDDMLEEMHETLYASKKSSRQHHADALSHRDGGSHQNGKKIDASFSGPATCVLHGIGGVGKTQAALEYTFRYRKYYNAIFWLPSERDPELSSAYGLISEKLKLVTGDASEEKKAEKIQRARRWLETTSRKWLLIFDNMEDIYDLNQYLPTNTKSNGAVIITTQHSDCHAVTEIFHKIDLRSFSREDAAKLLFKYLERDPLDEDEETAAEEISDIVDGLPLAIAAIGGYVNQSSSSLVEFIGNLKRSSNVWEASAIGPAKQYEKTLESVFDIALGELTPNARDLVNILAFLNPDSIPEDIFTAHFKKPVFDFVKTKDELTENIRILRRRQLIRRDFHGGDGYLSIHRTLQWNIILDLSRNQDTRWGIFRQTLTLLRRGMPKTSPLDIPEPEKWPGFERYVPQVLSVRTHCLWPEPPVELPVDFAEVLSDLSTYMWNAGLADEGNEALHTAIDIMDDQHVDKLDTRRSDIYGKLGILLSYNGVSDRRETLKRRTQALEIREKSFAEIPAGDVTRNDEIRLYNVKCDLAWTYLHEGTYLEAEPIMDECLEKYRSWDTEEKIPYEYAKYCSLMAFVRLCQKKPDLAMELSRRGAGLVIKAAGEDNPVTQMWKFALANVLALSGETKEALELNEEVRKTRINICGEFNHMTLESYSTCAALLLRLNKLDEAEKLLKKCLERRKRASWNPEGVARAQYRYSKVLQALGKDKEAKSIGEQASKTRKHFLQAYPDRLTDVPDEEHVFDQMVSVWDGRLTGELSQKTPTE